MSLIDVTDLNVTVGHKHIVKGVSLSIERGRTLGVVGESGSGKTMTMLTATGLFDAPNTRVTGSSRIDGTEVIGADERTLRRLQGNRVGFVFQDPSTSLNPLLTLERQLTEGPMTHLGLSRSEATDRALDLLRSVGLPDPEARLGAYPHQLSGGQKQRVMIAVALACDPDVLVADEPTTALDVTTQKQIVDLVARLQRERDMAVVWISHDLGVIGQIADDVAVLYRGEVIEEAPVAELFANPREDYTRTLLAARPVLGEGSVAPEADGPGAAEEPLLTVEDLRVTFALKGPTGTTTTVANDGVSLSVARGRTLGIVGESGSGKSTVAGVLTGLVTPDAGEVFLGGDRVTGLKGKAARALRRRLAMVFQDPYSALDPRMSVAASIAEPLEAHGIVRGKAAVKTRGTELLKSVGLDSSFLEKYPHELSGGQRQRVCIARALALEPELLILDESTASLDVSIQAQVIELLMDLQQRLGLAYLFIAHDLAVVERMSDDIVVMKDGKVVERAPAGTLYRGPQTDYTKSLIAAIPPAEPSRA